MDLLVVCVESGLGLDQAILQVSKELEHAHPEISEEDPRPTSGGNAVSQVTVRRVFAAGSSLGRVDEVPAELVDGLADSVRRVENR